MTNKQKLISAVVLTCIKNNIGLHFVNEEFVMADGIKCSGYFDEDDLKVATKKEEQNWLPILVHESCHMDQFLEKSKLWHAGECGIGIIDDWLQGKNILDAKLIKSFQDTIKLEIDCEKRSIKKIKKYNLDIKINSYIQKVNAYIFSYWATYRDKKWYPFPYSNPNIFKKMPNTILSLKEYLDKDTKYLNLYI